MANQEILRNVDLLYKIVFVEKFDYVSWNNRLRRVEIKDSDQFKSLLEGKYGKNFDSFKKSLNRFGFRITKAEGEIDYVITHEDFCEGCDLNLIKDIRSKEYNKMKRQPKIIPDIVDPLPTYRKRRRLVTSYYIPITGENDTEWADDLEDLVEDGKEDF